MMITKLTIKEPRQISRIHGERSEFTFMPGANVICGPNGSGKSTVLNAIVPRPGFPNRVKSEIEFDVPTKLEIYRSEVDGNTHKGYFDEDVSMGLQIAAMRISRGQGQAAYLGNFIKKSKEAEKGSLCLLLDEPDAAMDFAGVVALSALIFHISRSQQVILTAHAFPIIVNPLYHHIELVPEYRSLLYDATARFQRP
jgi:predicted ATPase